MPDVSAPSKRSGFLPVSCNRSVDTIIFLDVDGVLNVGAKSPDDNGAMALCETNMQHAHDFANSKVCKDSDRECAKRLIATHTRMVEDEDGTTYAKYSTPTGNGTNVIFVQRLARLIELAGPGCAVVLSSSWRRPKYIERVERLERAIGEQLGLPFAFEAMTPVCHDDQADMRIQNIGDFVEDHCSKHSRSLRMMVLDDLHMTSLDGLTLEGDSSVACLEDVERYLKSRMGEHARNASVCVVHTYDEWWREVDGVHMQIGAGLTQKHFSKALAFIKGGRGFEEATSTPADLPTKHDRALRWWSMLQADYLKIF